MTEHRTPVRSHRPLSRISALAVVACLALGACGDDDATAAAEPVGPRSAPNSQTVEVVAVDFEFERLPERVPAGTKLTLDNRAPTELHEIVALRLPDDEQRSADELVALPPEEMGPALASLEPALVILAAPGDDPVVAVGDGTLTEPGRYLLVCMIPTGVDPDAFFAAAAETEEGPPQIDGGGPPHLVHGMYAELIVE
jgi:hypothetical protein